MRVTTKGQVTIPQDVRRRLGVVPGSEVDFVISDGKVVLVKAEKKKNGRMTRGEKLVAMMTGKGTVKMTTDEIMRLTRGWGEEDDID